MANILTASRKLPGTAPMKGLKAIGFAPYDSLDLIDNSETGVVALPSSITAPVGGSIARFEVKATSNVFTETGTFDAEATRTNEYVGSLTVAIPGNDLGLTNIVGKLVGQRWVVFMEDYNGKIHVAGSQNGAEVPSAVFSTDAQGYTLTISTREKDLKYEVTGLGVTAYTTALLPN